MAFRFNPFTGNLDLIDPNVNADWNATSGDAQILNKPALGSLAALSSITDSEIAANAEIAVSKLADGSARQLLQTDAAGTGVEWASNIDIPGTLDVTQAATFDSTVSVPLGSASAPSLFPGTDTNTGLWSPGSDSLALSTNGVERARFSDTGTKLTNDLSLDDGGSFTTTLQTVTPTANRTLSLPDATGTVALVAGSSGQLLWNNAGANAGASTLTYDGSILTTSGRFINSYNATASSPAKVWTGTWFTGGTATTTKPHVLIEPTGTTSTAWSTSGTGLGVNAPSGFTGNLLDLQMNGTARFKVAANGTVSITGITAVTHTFWQDGLVDFGARLRIPSSAAYEIGSDVVLARDAADILAQRRTANAQTFRVYNTFTSATNNELGKLEWSSNVFRIGTEKGSGGGTARALELQTDSITRLALDTTGSVRVVTPLTVATLPGTPTAGMIARVTDATSPTPGSTVTGGGSANALCWYNGSNWTVLGV